MAATNSSLTISDQNLEHYGFACFHYRGEEQPSNGFWNREIELEKGLAERPEKVSFRIPEEQLICLSKKDKINTHPKFEICSVSDAIPDIKLLLERAGWNQTSEDLQLMSAQTADGTFLARYGSKEQNIVLGSGVSLPVSDDLAWIGMILVHPELRRQGIAGAIMHQCLSYVRTQLQKSIVGLDATPMGKQVYDSLGFRDSFLIWRSVLSTSHEVLKSSSCEITSMEQQDAIIYLSGKNYSERSALIALLSQLPGSFNLQSRKDGKMCGIALSRPGRLKPFIGALIADSPDVALELVKGITSHWKKNGYDELFMDIPEWHLSGESIFSREDDQRNNKANQIPVNPVRSLMRMYQLIATEEAFVDGSGMSEGLVNSSMQAYERTATFMNKEKYEIVPIMYGTSGPEWS